jgi:hypothetical protein
VARKRHIKRKEGPRTPQTVYRRLDSASAMIKYKRLKALMENSAKEAMAFSFLPRRGPQVKEMEYTVSEPFKPAFWRSTIKPTELPVSSD